MDNNFKLRKLNGIDIFTFLQQNKHLTDNYFWKYYQDYKMSNFENYIRDICEFLQPFGNVLSVGCGHGLNEMLMADMCVDINNIVGLDVIKNKIQTLNKIANHLGITNVKGLAGDAKRMEFPNKHFDTIIIIESLSHVDDQYRVLNESARILKRNGLIFVMDFNNGANPRVVFRSWKQEHFQGIEEIPVNPYYIRNRLRDMDFHDITMTPYKPTPLFEKLKNKLIINSINVPFSLSNFLVTAFMLKGRNAK